MKDQIVDLIATCYEKRILLYDSLKFPTVKLTKTKPSMATVFWSEVLFIIACSNRVR